MAVNKFLMTMCIIEVFSMGISICTAVSITKKIGSTSRALVNITRTVIIWVFGLIIHAAVSNPIYHY